MRCPRCNASVEKDDLFCPECGSPLEQKRGVNFPVMIVSLIIFVGIFLFIIFWLISDKSDSTKTFQKNTESAEQSESLDQQKQDSKEQASTQEEKAKKEAENNTQSEQKKQEEKAELEYILEESSSKYLTEADIQGLTIQQLNYAKNEIYARHGRKFDSNELRAYFNSKSWYKGIYEPADFDANYSAKVLSDLEKKNAEFLKNAEYKLSPSGYQLDK